MENLAGVDQRLEKLTFPGPFLDRKKQLQELRLVLVVCVFLQRFAQWQMLGLALSRQAMAIGCKEREGRVLVALVFGEVKTNPANEVPRAAPAREKVLHTAGRVAHRILNGKMQHFPEAGQHVLTQVLTADHGRGGGGMLDQFLPWRRQGNGFPGARLGQAGKRAKAGKIEARKVPPISEIGRKFRVQLGKPELHQAIAAVSCEGRLDAPGYWRSRLCGQEIERTVRRQCDAGGRRGHWSSDLLVTAWPLVYCFANCGAVH